eukprot:COSAG01_NODE_1653_length_9619_cov_43.055573_2_plen_208_part_00
MLAQSAVSSDFSQLATAEPHPASVLILVQPPPLHTLHRLLCVLFGLATATAFQVLPASDLAQTSSHRALCSGSRPSAALPCQRLTLPHLLGPPTQPALHEPRHYPTYSSRSRRLGPSHLRAIRPQPARPSTCQTATQELQNHPYPPAKLRLVAIVACAPCAPQMEPIGSRILAKPRYSCSCLLRENGVPPASMVSWRYPRSEQIPVR